MVLYSIKPLTIKLLKEVITSSSVSPKFLAILEQSKHSQEVFKSFKKTKKSFKVKVLSIF